MPVTTAFIRWPHVCLPCCHDWNCHAINLENNKLSEKNWFFQVKLFYKSLVFFSVKEQIHCKSKMERFDGVWRNIWTYRHGFVYRKRYVYGVFLAKLLDVLESLKRLPAFSLPWQSSLSLFITWILLRYFSNCRLSASLFCISLLGTLHVLFACAFVNFRRLFHWSVENMC